MNPHDRSTSRSPRLSRRDALRLAGGAGAGALATRGAGAPSAVAAQGTPSASATPLVEAGRIKIYDTGAALPTENVTVRWLDSGDLKAYYFEELFPAYQQAHPNITIEYEVLPNGEIATIVPLGIQNGDAHDVFQFGSSNITSSQAVREGWVQPVDDDIPNFAEWRQAVPPDLLLPGFTIFNDQLYGLPLYSPKRHSILLLYNVAYLEQAGYDLTGAPLTWDEFREVARRITEQGQGQYYGLVLEGQQTPRFAAFVGGLAQMAGAPGGDLAGGVFDWRTGDFVLTSDEFLAAIEFLLALRDDGSVFPGSVSLNAAQARALMPQGAAGMILQGPWNLPEWSRDNPDFAFGVASPPLQNSDQLVPLSVPPGGNDHWVYAESPHAAVIGDLYAHIFSVEGQRALLELSGGSSLVSFPEANQTADIPPLGRAALDLFEQQTRLGPDPRVRNPEAAQVYLEIQTVTPDLGETIQGLYTGQLQNPRQVMTDLQSRLEAEFERAITAAQATGAQVSRDDFVFPNWDPMEEYTDDDYAALSG